MKSVKRLIFVATFLMITFVAKQVLAGIPNVQAVSLLMALFFVKSNWKETIVFLIGYVLLDFIVWGYPTLMIPSFATWISWAFLVKKVGKDKEFINAFLMIPFTIIQILVYMLHDLLFFNLRIEAIPAYLIAGIPFAVPMLISGFVSILFLFKPLNRILDYIKT